jgi:hypothetical protein
VKKWTDIGEPEHEHDILVVGNGPSRVGRADLIRAFQNKGAVIGCNSCWKDGDWSPDWLVCFDKEQAKLALRETTLRVVAPRRDFRPEFQLPEEWWRAYQDRLWAIDPYSDRIPSANHDKRFRLPQGWSPEGLALGNLSGLLAFQFAAVLKARRVFLLGIDAGGTLSHGRVKLSACDPSWNGYGNHDIARTHCEEVGRACVPRGWQGTRIFWRLLHEWAGTRGIEVRRLTDDGSLSFIPPGAPEWLDQPTSTASD